MPKRKEREAPSVISLRQLLLTDVGVRVVDCTLDVIKYAADVQPRPQRRRLRQQLLR